MKHRTVAAIVTVLAGLAVPATVAGATGTNQYASGTASSSGLCHGAFANTNGNFGFLGSLGGATGGGVAAGSGTTGWNNSHVSGDCTLPNH